MRFDDRLLTVLNQPAGDRHDAAVRWRQLVDLVARAGPNSASPVVAEALESIRAEAPKVDESLRAAAARAVAALPLPLGLLEYFAADRLAVSAPVLAAASLDAGQWRSAPRRRRRGDAPVRRDPSSRARRPRGRRGHRGAGRAAEPEPHVEHRAARPAAPAPAAGAGTSLSDVVARIERRRRSREQQSRTAAPPRPRPERRRCSAGNAGRAGDIAWVDGAPRGALIGRSIATRPGRRRRGRRRGRRSRLRAARAVPRRRAQPARRRAGVGRMEDQRRAGVRAGRRALRRLSRGRAARPAAAVGAAERRKRDPDRPGFAARAGPRDQDAAERDHRFRRDHRRASISAPPTAAIASARARSSARRGCCWARSTTSISPRRSIR